MDSQLSNMEAWFCSKNHGSPPPSWVSSPMQPDLWRRKVIQIHSHLLSVDFKPGVCDRLSARGSKPKAYARIGLPEAGNVYGGGRARTSDLKTLQKETACQSRIRQRHSMQSARVPFATRDQKAFYGATNGTSVMAAVLIVSNASWVMTRWILD